MKTRLTALSMLTLITVMSAALPADSPVVQVDNVEALYAAVNDPANTGKTIRLAPGTYVLTPHDLAGQPRPGRGSLVLQSGMRLVGENTYVDHDGDGVFDPRDDDGDGAVDLDPHGREVFADPPTETIIDGTRLNAPVPGTGVVSGAILVGGAVEVSIGNLTVRGGAFAQAAIEVRGPGNDISTVMVTECTLEQGRRGILIDASVRWGSAGTSVTLNAGRNVIRDHRVDHLFPEILSGWGVHAQSASVTGAQVSVNVRYNRFRKNNAGLLIASLGMDDGQTTVVSHGNIYEYAVLTTDAVVGSVISGGIHMELRDFGTRGSRRNRSHLVSNDDRIWNNEGWAGLYVEGFRRTANNTEFIDNEIDIQMLGTRFVQLAQDGSFAGLQNREARVDGSGGDQSMRRRDITIVGANYSGRNLRNPPVDGFNGPASGNRVKLLVRGALSSLMPTTYDLAPAPFLVIDNAPNEVAIDVPGSATAFERTNMGLRIR